MKAGLKFIAIIFLLVAFTGSSVYTTTIDEMENELDQTEQAIEETKEVVQDLKQEQAALNNQITDLNDKMQSAQDLINNYADQVAAKQGEIETTKIELEAAIVQEALYQVQIADRVKVMYEYGDSGYLEVLLEADDLGDFFTRLEYLNKIMQYDNTMLAKLESIQAEIGFKQETLKNEEANLQHLQAEAELEKSNLESMVDQKSSLISEIENDKDSLLAKIEEMEAESAALASEIQKAIEASKLKFDGELKWPLPGNFYISSYFETRIHPIYGYTERHNGLDIPASYGTQIQAAASGVVIAARYSSSYGNMVIIDHGGGVATLYAHCSGLWVGVGESVSRGQGIAGVGSTGWSTGNHLHFGVQKDGAWMDPMAYFNN